MSPDAPVLAGKEVTVRFEGQSGTACHASVDWGANETKSLAATALPYPITYKHAYARPGTYAILAKGCGLEHAAVIQVGSRPLARR